MTNLPSNLPALLKAAGLKVVEVDGWQDRGRPATKGSFRPSGVLWHHTGSTEGGVKYADWLAKDGRSDLPAPLCHLSIGRDGTVYVCAAGRANHAGVAKASGPMPKGDGNEMYAGVECQNSGSEGWRPAQRAAMVTVGVVLGRDVIHCPASHQRGHKETSITGKWDPGKFDMDAFRTDIAKASAASSPQPAKKAPAKTNHVTAGRALIRQGIAELRRSPESRKTVHDRADEYAAVYKKGPTK